LIKDESMKLVEINWRPKDRQLRQFGLIALVALPFLGWVWNLNAMGVWTLGGIGAVAGLLALAYPNALRVPYLVLTLLTFPIGLVIGEVVLFLGYFLVFVPIGLLVRLFGRDELQLRIDPAASTYWQPKAQPKGLIDYLRQS
jgi:hypothetical protein